jgi:hypothetical protein
MTKGWHLAMKYQKTPFEDPNTCPNLGHSNLLTSNYDLVLSIVSLQIVILLILMILFHNLNAFGFNNNILIGANTIIKV